MKVNVSIKNNDIIPVPYIGKCGENVIVNSIYKDKPMLMEATVITTTHAGQIIIHGVKNDVIIPATPSIEIEFV